MNNFNAGSFIKTLSGYRAFQAEKINRTYQFDDFTLLPLIEKATLKLGELSAYSELVPDINHFIRLHVVKEATISSRIEGTQTNIEEAMMKEEDIDPEKRNDWIEVNNYVEAMEFSIKMLENLPISTRLIKQTHQILLQGVRGEYKLPGQFRQSQNWIGGASLSDAIFIPPIWNDIDILMGDLENFLHSDDTGLPHILKIALAHYQFETIHPFLDGNGRIGRLLISLYLFENKILRKPVLYLSDFFEKHKSLYYENLMGVRLKNNLNQWFRFFLVGVIETAEKSIDGLRKLIALKIEIEQERLPKLGKRLNKGNTLFQALFLKPVINAEEVAQIIGSSLVTAYKLIEDFQNLGILKESGNSTRSKNYIFHEYFKIFE